MAQIETAEEVGQWVAGLGFPAEQSISYSEAFRTNAVDADSLDALTMEDLEDVGISNRVHRRAIVAKWSKHRSNTASVAGTAGTAGVAGGGAATAAAAAAAASDTATGEGKSKKKKKPKPKQLTVVLSDDFQGVPRPVATLSPQVLKARAASAQRKVRFLPPPPPATAPPSSRCMHCTLTCFNYMCISPQTLHALLGVPHHNPQRLKIHATPKGKGCERG
jgi:hypothetical protein